MKSNTRIETRGEIAVITPLADFTVFFVREAAEDIDLLADQGVRQFIFHLAQVTWIDSLGIGCLLKAAQRTGQKKHKPVLVLADDRVKLSLVQAGVADQFHHASSIEKAREYFL